MSKWDNASATTFFFLARYSNVIPYSSRSNSQRNTRSEDFKLLKVLFTGIKGYWLFMLHNFFSFFLDVGFGSILFVLNSNFIS